MRRARGTAALLAALGGMLLLGTPAQAGVYPVYACAAAGTHWDNRSWALGAPVGGITADQTCPGNDINIGLNQTAGARTAPGQEAAFTFTTPAGTSIADFHLARRIIFDAPNQDGTRRYYAISALGSTVFEGAGDYADAVRNRLHAQGHWYGYPQANADTGVVTVSRASFPALAGSTGATRTLSVRIGCFARNAAPCSTTAGAHIATNLRGAEVDVADTAAPADVSVDASGLLRGGRVDGSDPVTVKATDPSGIRRLEIVDVTGPATVVGAEDYAAGEQTDRGGSCQFRQAAPCPQLSYGETLRATSLTTGERRLVVRAIDTGGNVTERGPYTVDVVTPSNRGALNGAGATETGTVQAAFTHGSNRTRRTIGFDSHAGVAGRLLNAGGQPVSGARVAVLTRDLDDDKAKLRTYVTTDADGRFTYRATAYASRLYQFAWTSHVNDVRYAANGYVTLLARASATLKASPRRPRLGHLVTLTGRLAGKHPRRSVDIVAQGRAGRHGAYRTFADGHIGRSGRFRLHYRFRDPGSRGRAFSFRVKIERDSGFAYWGGYSRTATVRVR